MGLGIASRLRWNLPPWRKMAFVTDGVGIARSGYPAVGQIGRFAVKPGGTDVRASGMAPVAFAPRRSILVDL